MTPLTQALRPFEPGTVGWTAQDLLDPAIEREWELGSYEIVEGVLAIMPAAYFRGGSAVFGLLHLLKVHFQRSRSSAKISVEVDLILTPSRVAKADAVVLTAEDERLQAAAALRQGRTDPQKTRILIPPTLVIESISPGHESHDRETKQRWYAEAGIPNYWILDAFEESLECLVLEGAGYRLDAPGKHKETVRPSLFPGLTLPLEQVWAG